MNTSPAMLWLTIFGVGLGTFALRASCIMLLGKFEQPPWMEAALRYVPPAVLAAIISSSLFIEGEVVRVDVSDPRLAAAACAAVVAWLTRSLFFTIAAGMVVLWLLQALWGTA